MINLKAMLERKIEEVGREVKFTVRHCDNGSPAPIYNKGRLAAYIEILNSIK